MDVNANDTRNFHNEILLGNSIKCKTFDVLPGSKQIRCAALRATKLDIRGSCDSDWRFLFLFAVKAKSH